MAKLTLILYRAIIYKNSRSAGPNTKRQVSEYVTTPEAADDLLTQGVRPGIDGGHIEERVPGIGWTVYEGAVA